MINAEVTLGMNKVGIWEGGLAKRWHELELATGRGEGAF